MATRRFLTLGTRVLGAALLVTLVAAVALDARSAPPRVAPRSLDDYRHFRIAAIDLSGRMPTRDEVAAFERSDFDLDRWIDAQLEGPGYAPRMTRIYMDLLRLEPNLNFSSGPAQLYRLEVQGGDGKPVYVFYRAGQRRTRAETDGTFCLSPEESGFVVRPNGAPVGTPKKVPKAILDRYTTVVRPWWLYKDYRSINPSLRFQFGEAGDAGVSSPLPDPDFRPVEALLVEPDGATPTVAVRVCNEEARTEATGHIYVSGRARPEGGAAGKGTGKEVKGRGKPAPFDRPYALKHAGEPVACDTRTALDFAADCGCGPGLERCIPNDSDRQGGRAFYFPDHAPLGSSAPLDSARQQAQRWFPYWWSREAVHFLDDLFASDRDFREILTGRQTFVNGPLAQFYRSIQRGNCCGPELQFGMAEETEPLFDPRSVPPDLAPQDTGTWERVGDRGPHAAGILTLPMFLEKYASARARGAALYTAFLCKSFAADAKTDLPPSSEPDLTIRPGCSTCHATLEPLASYFARVEPGSFVFLPPSIFPARNPGCRRADASGKLNGRCNALYDPAFVDASGAALRSSYAAPAHADATPSGAAVEIARSPEFAACAVQRVTSSFLGRPITRDDAPLVDDLTREFVSSGYRMRALVHGIVRSPAYGRSNNVSSASWRDAAAGSP